MPRAKPSARRKRPARRRRPSASKSRALETALAEFAHDIRTPLSGILALSELLSASELTERERGWARAIKSTGEHLNLLTSLIVDAVRASTKGLVLRRERVRPRQLAEALGASLAARAESKGLKAEIAIAEDLPPVVMSDLLRLRAALENVIDNAVKFTERGSVRFAVASEKAARGRARLVFTITDTGLGLTAADIKRLFRPFAQASAAVAQRFGGAGLGLSSVKRIAKAMGGDLAITSKPRGGSAFRLAVLVDLPGPADGAAAGAATGALGVPTRPLAILCAEDNPHGRVVLNTILTELGHHVDFVGIRRCRGRGVSARPLRPHPDGRDAAGDRWLRGDAPDQGARCSGREHPDRRHLRPRTGRRRRGGPRRRHECVSAQAAKPEHARSAAAHAHVAELIRRRALKQDRFRLKRSYSASFWLVA